MVTDLVQIRVLAETDAGENLRFRRFLKAHHVPDHLFRRIAREVEQQIDCKACANCCREPCVHVTRRDIETLARYLHIPPEQFVKEYTVVDPEDRETILRQTKDGCGSSMTISARCTKLVRVPVGSSRISSVINAH